MSPLKNVAQFAPGRQRSYGDAGFPLAAKTLIEKVL
jgi:hypothetical protein